MALLYSVQVFAFGSSSSITSFRACEAKVVACGPRHKWRDAS